MTTYLQTSKISIAIALIFSLQCRGTFSQTTHLKILLNQVNNSFNYGASNSLMQPYKKNAKGVLAGASFQAGITPLFSLVTETYFTMKGAVLKSGNPGTTGKSTTRLYTAELPLLARLHMDRFYINAGPSISYAIAGKIKTDASHTNPAKYTSISFHNGPNGFKRWETGIQTGAGYNFQLKKATLVLDVRYVYGLTNISRDAEKYNRAFNISLIAVKPWKNNPLARRHQTNNNSHRK